MMRTLWTRRAAAPQPNLANEAGAALSLAAGTYGGWACIGSVAAIHLAKTAMPRLMRRSAAGRRRPAAQPPLLTPVRRLRRSPVSAASPAPADQGALGRRRRRRDASAKAKTAAERRI